MNANGGTTMLRRPITSHPAIGSISWSTIRAVAAFGLFGPFIGGLPLTLNFICLAFVYLVGIVPAIVTGIVYAVWRDGSPAGSPPIGHRMLTAAPAGAVVAALWGMFLFSPFGAWLAIPGAFGAAGCAALNFGKPASQVPSRQTIESGATIAGSIP